MANQASFTFYVPVPCTEDDVREWIHYSLGYIAGISIENPLHDQPLEAVDVDFGSTSFIPVSELKSLPNPRLYCATIMDEMAADELKSMIQRLGPEAVLTMAKAGQEV